MQKEVKIFVPVYGNPSPTVKHLIVQGSVSSSGIKSLLTLQFPTGETIMVRNADLLKAILEISN